MRGVFLKDWMSIIKTENDNIVGKQNILIVKIKV